MPPRMELLHYDLSELWENIVRSGQIRNRFVGRNGRQIESGLRMTLDGPQHYAIDQENGTQVGVGVRERRIEGSEFVLQLNLFRALKPKPETLGLGRQPDSSAEAKDCLFACENPTSSLSLLRRNIHFQARFPNYQWAAVHNALPVEKNGHFLWVPARIEDTSVTFPHSPQILTRPLLQDFLALASLSTGSLTLFNAMHAGGSVNHIHYHSVYRAARMPLEEAPSVIKGGRFFLEDYPASGLAYSDRLTFDRIWVDIEKLQSRGVPINLIHSADRTFVFARRANHEVVAEFPGGVLAGMELLGRPITTEEDFYREADWETIRTALYKSTLRDEEVLAMLES